MKITISTLKQEVKEQNVYMVESGSNWFFRFAPRNPMQGVDLMYVCEDGVVVCNNNLEAGTSRKCYYTLLRESKNLHGGIRHPLKPTRAMAKGVLLNYINFDKGYFSSGSTQKEKLLVWAKLTKYRKPSNCSIEYGFFHHLQERVKLA